MVDLNRLLIYMHIPKTGGTSLTHIINQNYETVIHLHEMKENYLPLLTERLEVADALCGHIPFGIHNHTSRPYNYITMLRDPVEHVISWFYFKYKNPLYTEFYDKEKTLDDYISDSDYVFEYINLQTRFISGEMHTLTPDLNLAKSNLLHHFSFVGITEMYTESQFMFMKEMRWKLQICPRLNITQYRPLKDQLSNETIKKIRKNSAIDMELYDFANQLLQERMDALSPRMQKKLLLFKKRNND